MVGTQSSVPIVQLCIAPPPTHTRLCLHTPQSPNCAVHNLCKGTRCPLQELNVPFGLWISENGNVNRAPKQSDAAADTGRWHRTAEGAIMSTSGKLER